MARKPKKEAETSDDQVEITKWLSRIDRAEKHRDDADLKFGFSRACNEYQNDFQSAMPSWMQDTDLVPINEVYAYTKTFVPSVYARDPHITVNPKSTKAIAGAKIGELGVNDYWKAKRLKREVKRAIVDAILAEGWVKCGYTSVFGSIVPEDGKPPLESSEFIKSEDIFATRVSWRNMVRDPDAVNGLFDARWIAQKLILPLEAVQASTIYENTDDLKANYIVTDKPDQPNRQPQGSDECQMQYVVLWEIWDRDLKRVLTLAEGHEKYLMDKEWPYKDEGFPYALLRFNENPDECYAPNLIMAWEPQLWEKIKLRSMQLDHVKRFNRQLSVEKGAMSKNELSKLAMGKTGSVTERTKGTLPPAPVEYAQLQPDIYAIENKIDLDKDNISGQPNAVRSAPQKTQSRTLGEIDRLISSFGARQAEPQDIVEDFCEEIAYKILGLMQQYLDGEQYVRCTRRDIEEIAQALVDPKTGASRFDGRGFRYSKKDIEDIEFEVDVRSGSTIPLDRQNRIESLSTLLKLGPTIGIQPGGLVSRALGKALISEFELKEVEAAYEEEQAQMDKMKQVTALMQQQQVQGMDQKVQHMRQLKSSGAIGAMQAAGQPPAGGGGAPGAV